MRSPTIDARRMPGLAGLALTTALVVAACTAAGSSPSPAAPTAAALPPTPIPTLRSFDLASSAFINEGDIPVKYTCNGDAISPPLAWQGAPAETAAFVLIMEDYSADVLHWIVVDLPGGPSGSLPEGFSRSGDGAIQIKSYLGPCPYGHRNMYHFGLYALSAKLELAGATKVEVETAMRGKTIAYASLSGWYQIADQ